MMPCHRLVHGAVATGDGQVTASFQQGCARDLRAVTGLLGANDVESDAGTAQRALDRTPTGTAVGRPEAGLTTRASARQDP